MPKLKKPPKNSCYFYMQERKLQLEAQGHRFPQGIKDVFTSCGPEWSRMSKDDKAKYEAMAKKYKEEEKHDLTNKFTASGESYAQVQERMRIGKESAERKSKLIHDLVFEGNVKERVFILMKSLHSVEQILQHGKMYWPTEIAVVAFTLQGGLKKFLWKLVDTVKPPLGYASSAKESSEECGIPLPGSDEFSEQDRDYKQIFGDIQSFIETTLSEYEDNGVDYVVFCKQNEIEPAKDSLLWLLEHILEENEDKSDKRNFLENLQFCELGQLMIKLAVYGNHINPSYPSQLAQIQNIHSANTILDMGSFDYRSEITCSQHLKGEASQKMNFCCKNVALRRMYLMFREFLPQYGIDEEKRHDISRLPKEPTRSIKHPTSQLSSEAVNSPPRGSSNAWNSKTSPTSAYKNESWPQEPDSSSNIDTFSGSRLRNDPWSRSTGLSSGDPADWPTPTNSKVEEETRLWSSSQLRQIPSEAMGSDVANNDGLHKVESAVSSSQEPQSKTKGAWDFRASGNDRPSSSRDRERKDSPNLDGASSTGAEDAYSTPWRSHVQPKDVKDKELNFNDDNFPSLESPMGRGARKREDAQDDDEGNPWVVGLGRGRAKRK